MLAEPKSWFADWWASVVPSLQRRPSALLLHGPAGTGKTAFALEVASAWLCPTPLPDRSACGTCPSCVWMKSAQHPDFRWVRPDAQADNPDSSDGAGETQEGTPAEPAGEAKKKSQEIRIEQIRALSGFANIGSHRGGLRIVLISPANRMNYASANALLKTLEEPADSLSFILTADTLAHIPATVLSRCRRLSLNVPEEMLGRLQTEANESSGWLLPLLEGGSLVDPIRWAEKAGKSPPGMALELLMRWMTDAQRVAVGLGPRAFPEKALALKEQALRIRSPQIWAQTLAEYQRLRAIAEHPLNPKLFYETIFQRLRSASVAQ